MVSALAKCGRKDEAAKAAAQFRKDYPMSLLGMSLPDTVPNSDAGP